MIVTINQEITVYLDESGVAQETVVEQQIINIYFNYDPSIILKLIESIRIVDTADTAITVYADDWAKMFVTSSNTPVTVTISSDISEAGGQLIYFQQGGLGDITLVAGVGVTLLSPDGVSTRTQNSTICIVQTALHKWVCMGDLAYYV